MSLSNILEPNFYDLYCNSITANIAPSGSTGATGPAGPTGATGAAGPGQYLVSYGSWYVDTLSDLIPNNAPTLLIFDAFTNNGSQFSLLPVNYNSSTGIFTCTKNCIMNCSYSVIYQNPSNTGYRQVYISQTNVDGRAGLSSIGSQAASGSIDNVNGALSSVLSIGDTFSVNVYQNSGSAQALASRSSSTVYTRINITFVYQA